MLNLSGKASRIGWFGRFRAARRAGVAALFAITLVPLLLASGTAIDFTRLEILKTSLQSVTDGAALAGASALCLSNGSTDATTVATDYFNKGVATLATTAVVGKPTVTLPSTIEVTVTASATLQYSLMGLVGSGWTVSTAASAEGPAYQLQVTKTGGFSSSASDSNSVYFYTVSGNGTLPTSTSSMTLLFTNDSSVDPNYQADNVAAKVVRVGANDEVGFALVNKTGGISSYSENAYGGTQGSIHYFYSSAAVPSASAYSSQGSFYTGQTMTYSGYTFCDVTRITSTMNSYAPTGNTSCYPHPCTEVSGNTVLQNNLLVAGTCSSPTTAARTCLQLYNNPQSYSWNDMGGYKRDDYDYNDANYTVTCSPASSNPQPESVILVQ